MTNLELAIEYHKTVEGEYGCPGASCPGVKRLIALLEKAEAKRGAHIAEVEAVLDELTAPDPDGKPLAQRLRDELADFHMVLDHASKVFYHVTDGAIGKVNTLPRVVCAVADEVTMALIDAAVKEARAEWEEERVEVVKACPNCGMQDGQRERSAQHAQKNFWCDSCDHEYDTPTYWQRVKGPTT